MTGRDLALALLPAFLLSGCSSRTAPEPHWVGHLAPLSGPGKAEGVQARLAVRLAVEEATKSEVKVAGRPLAVRHVDTRGDAETARAEAVRLLTVNKVAGLLVGVDAAQAERVGRESTPYGVPALVCGELALPPGENVWVLGAGPAARGRALARCAANEVKAESVAVVTDGRSALAGALAAAFVRQCRQDGKPAVQEGEFLNDAELKERVDRVAKARPGAVLVAAGVRDFLRVRAGLRDAGLRAPVLFGGEDAGAAELRTEAGDGPEVYLASAFAVEGLSEKGRDFARRFQEAAGEPPTLAAALAYDGTRLLFDTVRQAGTVSGARVREHLAKVETFESVTGALSFKDRQARRPVFVVRIQGGEAKVVTTVAAEE